MTYEEAYLKFEDEYVDWLHEHHVINNGTMLVHAMENTCNFDNFMSDEHPQIELV